MAEFLLDALFRVGGMASHPGAKMEIPQEKMRRTPQCFKERAIEALASLVPPPAAVEITKADF